MTLSKTNEPVTGTPSDIFFELLWARSTPSLNVSATLNVSFPNKQIRDGFNNLCHNFPYTADGKIGNLLGVNACKLTYPTQVIQGNQLFVVKTKIGWTLADEYEKCFTNNHLKSCSLPKKAFVFQVSRNWKDEIELDELLRRFWRIELEGNQPHSKPPSPLDQWFLQTMKDSINFDGERFEIKLPWKTPSWKIITFPLLVKSKA